MPPIQFVLLAELAPFPPYRSLLSALLAHQARILNLVRQCALLAQLAHTQMEEPVLVFHASMEVRFRFKRIRHHVHHAVHVRITFSIKNHAMLQKILSVKLVHLDLFLFRLEPRHVHV
jgi:hypothetical protein